MLVEWYWQKLQVTFPFQGNISNHGYVLLLRIIYMSCGIGCSYIFCYSVPEPQDLCMIRSGKTYPWLDILTCICLRPGSAREVSGKLRLVTSPHPELIRLRGWDSCRPCVRLPSTSGASRIYIYVIRCFCHKIEIIRYFSLKWKCNL